MADFQIRRATADDADAIADIFNAGTNASPANNLVTWQESGTDRAKWIADLDADGYPVFVATDDSGVIGFAAYFQFVIPGIYYGTVEDTIYLSPAATGRGVGTTLLSAVVEHAGANPYVHTMITYIVDTNEASLALHRKLGFEETGRMPNIHTKNDQRLGLVHLQRHFK